MRHPPGNRRHECEHGGRRDEHRPRRHSRRPVGAGEPLALEQSALADQPADDEERQEGEGAPRGERGPDVGDHTGSERHDDRDGERVAQLRQIRQQNPHRGEAHEEPERPRWGLEEVLVRRLIEHGEVDGGPDALPEQPGDEQLEGRTDHLRRRFGAGEDARQQDHRRHVEQVNVRVDREAECGVGAHRRDRVADDDEHDQDEPGIVPEGDTWFRCGQRGSDGVHVRRIVPRLMRSVRARSGAGTYEKIPAQGGGDFSGADYRI